MNQNPEQINRIIVLGLLAVDAVLWIGIFIVYVTQHQVDNAIVLAASGIPSGLIGFISRDHKPASSTGDDSVIINNPTDADKKAIADQPKE